MQGQRVKFKINKVLQVWTEQDNKVHLLKAFALLGKEIDKEHSLAFDCKAKDHSYFKVSTGCQLWFHQQNLSKLVDQWNSK